MTYYLYEKTQTAMERYLCLITDVVVCTPASPVSAGRTDISNFITSFAEDPKGYIWIGANHGLNRFSGSNYTVYYAQEESTALNSDYVDNFNV